MTSAKQNAPPFLEGRFVCKESDDDLLWFRHNLKVTVGAAAAPWENYMTDAFMLSFSFFLMIAIYLPLVPYIIFIGQVIEWLASVIIGVCAAPFLAFAHFDTEGEGLGQRTHYGYTFMLSSFIRPLLLIISFVVAASVIEVSTRLLTATYSFAVADVQANSLTGLISIFGYCALYLVLAVGMVNTSCALMHTIPDAILKFMGADTGSVGFGKHQTEAAAASVLAGKSIFKSGSKQQQTQQPQALGGLK